MSWDEHAATWDDDPAVRAYAAAAFARLEALVVEAGGSLEGLRVLDFGCGTGLLTEALAPRCEEVVALDAAAKMVAVLQHKVETHAWSHVHPLVGTLEEVRDRGDVALDGPFDLIVASSVCAFLRDYPRTAKELVSLLAPGARFVQLDWELDPEAEESFGLSRAAIREALGDAGLTELRVETAFERDVGGFQMKPLLGTGRKPD